MIAGHVNEVTLRRDVDVLRRTDTEMGDPSRVYRLGT